MPEVFSVSAVQPDQVPVIVAKKYHAARRGHRPRPRVGIAGHRILPLAIARLRIECAQEELSDILRLGTRAAARKIPFGGWLFGGTGVHVALLESHNIEQADGRIEGRRHPVGSPLHARTDAVAI